MNQEDYKHTNEFGEIEAFKHTKYWLKRDIQTIKKTLKSTIKFSPLLFLLSTVLATIMSFSYTSQFIADEIAFYALIFFPLFLLANLLIYVMVNKGYNISADGTTIDQSRNPNTEFFANGGGKSSN